MENRTDGNAQRTKRALNADRWAREVAGWKGSGLSGRAYAEMRGYPVTSLYWWARVDRRGKVPRSAPRTGTVAAAAIGPPRPMAFVPVVVRPSGDGHKVQALRVQAEIMLRGGRSVRLLGDLGLSDLGAVLRAVEGGVSC